MNAVLSNCPLCGAPGEPSGVTCPTSWGEVQQFLRCPRCRSLFDPQGKEPSYDAGYYVGHDFLDLKLYVEKAASTRMFSHLVLEAERALAVSRLNLPATNERKMLEVGCGPGLLLDIARFRGWQVTGLEPSAEAAEWGRQKLGLEIVQGMLRDRAPIQDANVAIASEVIEHASHPAEFAQALYGSLAPAGVALLTTPNAESGMLRKRGSSWVHLGMGYHMVMYSAASLGDLLRRAGFAAVVVTTFEGDERLMGIALKNKVPQSILASVTQTFDDDAEANQVSLSYLEDMRARFQETDPALSRAASFRVLETHIIAADYRRALDEAQRVREGFAAEGVTEQAIHTALDEASRAGNRTPYYDRIPTYAPNALFLEGVALLQTGAFEQALERFRVARGMISKLEPIPPSAYEDRVSWTPLQMARFHEGVALLRLGRAADALAQFEELLARRDDIPLDSLVQICLHRAFALRALGRPDDALHQVASLPAVQDLPPALALNVERARSEFLNVALTELFTQLETERATRHMLEAQRQYLRYRAADKLNNYVKSRPTLHRIGKAAAAGLMQWRQRRRGGAAVPELSPSSRVARMARMPRLATHERVQPAEYSPLPPVPKQSAQLAGCTIVAKNYLPYARVLAKSFQQHNPACPFFVLIVDRVEGRFDPANENFLVLEAHTLDIPNSSVLFTKYSVIEASTAVKPYFLQYLFTRHDIEKVIYLDPDILVTDSLAPVGQLLDQHSFVLTPHLTAPINDRHKPGEFTILQAGAYNLGFIGMRRGVVSDRMLAWWQARLYDQCFMAPERGMCVDQKWVDLVPGLFGGAFVLRDPGYNVAYWNLHERRVHAESDSRYTANGEPLRFFHFSGIDPENLDPISKHQTRFRLRDLGEVKALFERYRDLVTQAGWPQTKRWPYTYDSLANGIRIPAVARRLYSELGAAASALPDPFDPAAADAFVDWLNEPSDGCPGSPVTRLWYRVYQERSDLRTAYPDIFGADRDRFFAWILNSGYREYDVDPVFMPEAAADTADEEVAPAVSDALGVNLVGYVNSEKGMGEAVRADIRSLKASGLPFVINNFVDLGGLNLEAVAERLSSGSPHPVNIFHLNADQVTLLQRERRHQFTGRYNVGYWTWELSKFPKRWKSSFKPFDEIWVPSSFVAEAVRKISPIPVICVPHSVAIDEVDELPVRSRYGLAESSFLFLYFFDFHSEIERKNPLGLIQAFRKAFAPEDDAELFIKCAHVEYDRAGFERLKEAGEGARVVVQELVLPRRLINALLNSASCYVSLHRSEGFGFTMAESMALGKPVIATGYSGNMDFMNDQNSFLVRYRMKKLAATHGPYDKGNEWADPELDHAAELMRFVYEKRDQAAAVAQRGREDVLNALSPAAVGKIMRGRLEAIDKDLLAKRCASVSASPSRRTPAALDPKRAASYVARLQRNWDNFGRQDPMYWILTDPAKKGNRWDPEEFFRTGVSDINAALEQVRSAGLQLRMRRALDFGCGLGRLTQALAQQFEEAHGVDISPSMISKAQSLNRYPERCFYHQNGAPDLRLFKDDYFDFIYSIIVLQHIHPNVSRRYISEFMRVLRPGGVAVFQVPSELARRDLSVPSELERAAAPAVMDMFGVHRREVTELVEQAGASLSRVIEDPIAGPDWISFRYFVVKSAQEEAQSATMQNAS
jgi:SAM-dependent methyltransferase/glycosyltransferase involved in cell wall biosynthesis